MEFLRGLVQKLRADQVENIEEAAKLAHLEEGLALAEEGDDIMTSIRHSVENDQQWSDSAHVG